MWEGCLSKYRFFLWWIFRPSAPTPILRPLCGGAMHADICNVCGENVTGGVAEQSTGSIPGTDNAPQQLLTRPFYCLYIVLSAFSAAAPDIHNNTIYTKHNDPIYTTIYITIHTTAQYTQQYHCCWRCSSAQLQNSITIQCCCFWSCFFVVNCEDMPVRNYNQGGKPRPRICKLSIIFQPALEHVWGASPA